MINCGIKNTILKLNINIEATFQGISVTCTSTGVKNLHKAALKYDIGKFRSAFCNHCVYASEFHIGRGILRSKWTRHYSLQTARSKSVDKEQVSSMFHIFHSYLQH